MEIDRVYIGLPSELKSKILWINRRYRKNDLSFQIGGTDIIIEYTNRRVLGYDWVKYPGRYIKKIFNETFLRNPNENELEKIRNNVSKIYAKKYNADKYNTEQFKEIWNNKSSNDLPYELLDIYTNETYLNYLNFFINNIEFAKLYISVNYPFDYNYLINNKIYLNHGSAYYSVFISDTDSAYLSTFGLSYNKNIKWNSKLKAEYEYGFLNPFLGHIEGTGGSPIPIEKRDYLDNIIPLDRKTEIECRNEAVYASWSAVIEPYIDFNNSEEIIGPNLYDINNYFEEHSFLQISEFKNIFNESRLTILLNESIWNNTLKYIIDDSFCDKIVSKLKGDSKV